MPEFTGTLVSASDSVSATGLRDSLIAVVLSGTYAGVEAVFEASLDGSVYFPVALSESGTGVLVTETSLLTNHSVGYGSLVPIRAIDTFRVRAIAHTSGTVNVTIRVNKPFTEPAPLESLIYGRTTVTTAGTAVLLLGASTETNTFTITALEGNTGNIYIGDSSVDSTNGYIVPPGSSVSLDHDHAIENIYIDSDVNGEGVCYLGSAIES
jgi:hypothetical protein